jgi:hypothetical protein
MHATQVCAIPATAAEHSGWRRLDRQVTDGRVIFKVPAGQYLSRNTPISAGTALLKH